MDTTNQLKRTHAKPYKVGKLYFGRAGTTRGSGWVVSRNADLSSPVETFEVGKQARFYCEDVRDGKIELPATSSDTTGINIPSGVGMTNIFDEVSDNKIV